MNLSQITLLLEVYKKTSVTIQWALSNGLFFIGANAKTHQEYQDEGNQAVLPFLNNNLIIN